MNITDKIKKQVEEKREYESIVRGGGAPEKWKRYLELHKKFIKEVKQDAN